MLFHVALGRKGSFADVALEGPFLGVASIVNFQGRIAGERLQADVTRGVGAPYHGDGKRIQS